MKGGIVGLLYKDKHIFQEKPNTNPPLPMPTKTLEQIKGLPMWMK